MLMRRFAFSLLALATLPTTVHAKDECNDVLIAAAQNITKIDKTDYTEKNLKKWYCSAESEKIADMKNGDISIGIPIDGIPASIGAKSSNSSMVDRRKKFCGDDQRNFTDFEALAVLKRVASSDAIKAWSDCIKGHSQGQQPVTLDFSVLEGFISAVLKFNPPGGGMQEPILDQISVSGATCSGINIGQKIPIQGLPFICTRNNSKIPASLMFGTSYGVKVASIGAIKEGSCNVYSVYKRETWKRQSQPKETSFDTADLNCKHHCNDWEGRSGVNHDYKISVADNERIIPKSVEPSTSCSSIPGHSGDGCPFTSTVAGPTYSDRVASVTIRSWSVPVRLKFSVYAESRSYISVIKDEASLTVKSGKTFLVKAPKTAEKTSVACKLSDANEFSFDPSETESNEYVRRISVNDSGVSTVFTFKIRDD